MKEMNLLLQSKRLFVTIQNLSIQVHGIELLEAFRIHEDFPDEIGDGIKR